MAPAPSSSIQNGGGGVNPNDAANMHRLLSLSSSSLGSKEGLLEASILSVYDLPYSEPPTNVTLQACGMTVLSGPPLARHKDKNSFRFSSSSNSSSNATSTTSSNNNNTLKLVAPLRDLYKSQLTIRVVYGSGNSSRQKTLETSYDIRQLRIHESKWLILNLKPSSGQELVTVSNDDDDDDEVPPTIRIKLHLSGPYRPEIAAMVALFQSWFGLVDGMETQSRQLLQPVTTTLSATSSNLVKYLSIPTVPLVTVLVVASPVLMGILMVTMPFLLPVVLAILAGAVGVGGSAAFLYASTKHGREHVGGTLAPVTESLVSSRAGQALIYDIGARPTPVSVLRPVLPKSIWSKLILSLWIDLIGSSSYLLPVVGEALDLGWAPAQTVFVMAMYDTISPNLKFVSFAEEILPFTDIVPTATIGWALEFGPSLLGNHPQVVEAANQLLAQGRLVATSNNSSSTTMRQ